MRTVDRYIGHGVVGATLTVLVVLLAIFAFFTFIDELEEVGRGTYGLLQACVVVGLRVPGLAYDLFPVAALIGSLLGLGAMVENNEIAVVRCAGVSRARLVWSVMKAGLLFVFLAVLVGEVVFPPAERFARDYRSLAIEDRVAMRSEHGFWARDGESFINIREVLPGNRFGDITIFEFDEDNRLRIATHAETAVHAGGRWELRKISQTVFEDGEIEARRIEKASWDSLLKPDLVGMIAIEPSALSLLELSRYVTFTRRSGQQAQRYEHAMWSKIGYPLATAVMVFLAIPIVLRGSRSVPTGRRVMIGAVIGLTFHIVNQTAGHLGVVFGLPAFWSALGPTLAVFALAVALHLRVP